MINDNPGLAQATMNPGRVDSAAEAWQTAFGADSAAAVAVPLGLDSLGQLVVDSAISARAVKS